MYWWEAAVCPPTPRKVLYSYFSMRAGIQHEQIRTPPFERVCILAVVIVKTTDSDQN